MKIIITTLFLFSIVLFISCGKEGDDQQNNDQQSESDESTGNESMDELVENMKEVQKNMKQSQKYEVVDFRDLKALLPESLGDLKRSNAQGEKNSAMGFTISKANADYNNEDYSRSIDIEITDLAGATGYAGLAAWGWAMVDIDKETETGYEKTAMYNGHKGYEKYENEYQNGSLEILVSGRFMVAVHGNNIPMDMIKSAFDEIDISKLESMSQTNPINN